MASGNCAAGARKRTAQRAFPLKPETGFKGMLGGLVFHYFPVSVEIWTQLSHFEGKNTRFPRN